MNAVRTAMENALEQMVGEKCWAVERNGIGSNLCIQFGGKVCDVPPHIFPRTGEIIITGEYSFIIFCSWRIETASRILCTWQDCMLEDDEPEKEEFLDAVACLQDSLVVDASVRWPAGDLMLHFNNDMVIAVFADLSVEDPDHADSFRDCYFFSTVDTLFTVERGGELTSTTVRRRYDESEETQT